jgi:transcriptional regulator with XRE-family HTH domain
MDRPARPQPGDQFAIVRGAFAEIRFAHASLGKEGFHVREYRMMRFHDPILSAIADRSSAIYRGRAKKSEISHITVMNSDAWRTRIEEAVREDGRSLRDISLAAGLSHGYLHGILRDGKEPTLDRFTKICKTLNVSLAYALMGIDVSDSHMALIQEIERGGPRADAILSLLRAK